MQLNGLVRAFATTTAVFVLGGISSNSMATPVFAAREHKPCLYCHVVPGGPRNYRGLYYASHGFSFADFDNVAEANLAGAPPNAMGADASPTNPDYPDVKVPAALNFVVKDIDGNPVNMARYLGKVVMVVNVASLCGNTPQYAGLEQMYDEYKSKGLVILGFPENDFLHQEPGNNAQIKQFCTSKYHVTFPMFSKIDVLGPKQAPLYKFLTSADTDPKFAGPIDWNFAKFIINRKGQVVARFKAGLKPTTPEVLSVVQAQLAAH